MSMLSKSSSRSVYGSRNGVNGVFTPWSNQECSRCAHTDAIVVSWSISRSSGFFFNLLRRKSGLCKSEEERVE